MLANPKPDPEFCRSMGCGAWNYEEDRCKARECPYPEELMEVSIESQRTMGKDKA